MKPTQSVVLFYGSPSKLIPHGDISGKVRLTHSQGIEVTDNLIICIEKNRRPDSSSQQVKKTVFPSGKKSVCKQTLIRFVLAEPQGVTGPLVPFSWWCAGHTAVILLLTLLFLGALLTKVSVHGLCRPCSFFLYHVLCYPASLLDSWLTNDNNASYLSACHVPGTMFNV